VSPPNHEKRGAPRGLAHRAMARGLSEPHLSQSLLSAPSVVGVGKVNSCATHLVELLPLARDGVRQVDDIEDFGSSEPGDLDSSHAATLGPRS
jgi:hypothetical protein